MSLPPSPMVVTEEIPTTSVLPRGGFSNESSPCRDINRDTIQGSGDEANAKPSSSRTMAGDVLPSAEPAE